MHRGYLHHSRVGALALVLLAHAPIAVAAPSDGVQPNQRPIEGIIAQRVKLALPEGDQPQLHVVDDSRIGLFGAATGLPIDAIRHTRSVRDLDVLVKLKLARFMPRKPFKLSGAAAVAATVVAATVSNYAFSRYGYGDPYSYPPSAADNPPVDAGEDRAITAQLAGLVSADGCGARTIALLRRIAAGPGQGQMTAASLDARRLLKRLGSGAYDPTDGCDAPEIDPGYISAIAAAS